MPFNHALYDEVLLTVSTLAELAILALMWKEGSKITSNINEIHSTTSGTVFGQTDDLPVGTRVVVRQPQSGLKEDQWPFGSDIWVIREVDKLKNRALATPVFPPINGPTPTVEGPMTGPKSPFKKAGIAS